MANEKQFTVVLSKAELDEGWIGECLEIEGCRSQGETREEAKANLKDAIYDCLETMLEKHLQQRQRKTRRRVRGRRVRGRRVRLTGRFVLR